MRLSNATCPVCLLASSLLAGLLFALNLLLGLLFTLNLRPSPLLLTALRPFYPRMPNSIIIIVSSTPSHLLGDRNYPYLRLICFCFCVCFLCFRCFRVLSFCADLGKLLNAGNKSVGKGVIFSHAGRVGVGPGGGLINFL